MLRWWLAERVFAGRVWVGGEKPVEISVTGERGTNTPCCYLLFSTKSFQVINGLVTNQQLSDIKQQAGIERRCGGSRTSLHHRSVDSDFWNSPTQARSLRNDTTQCLSAIRWFSFRQRHRQQAERHKNHHIEFTSEKMLLILTQFTYGILNIFNPHKKFKVYDIHVLFWLLLSVSATEGMATMYHVNLYINADWNKNATATEADIRGQKSYTERAWWTSETAVSHWRALGISVVRGGVIRCFISAQLPNATLTKIQ